MGANLKGNNVSSTSAATGQGLVWNGTQWAPATLATTANLPTLVFQPGGALAYNVFTTWADLYNAFVATNGPVEIAIDDTFAIPSPDPGTWDFQYRATFVPHNTNISPQTNFVIPDGSTILDAATVRGQLLIICQGTTAPCFAFSANPTFDFDGGAQIQNAGTQPVFRLGVAGQLMSLGVYQGAQFTSPGGGALVDLSIAGVGLILFAGFFPQFSTSNVVTGVAGSNFTFLYDSSLQGYPTNPGFAGTTTAFAYSASNYTSYNDLAVAPPLGSSNVQGAIDALKAVPPKILSTLTFQPGGTPAYNVFTTWTDLYAAFNLTKGPVDIAIDVTFAPASVPVGVWDMQGRATLTATPSLVAGNPVTSCILTMPEGAVLRDLNAIDNGLCLYLLATVTPCLQLSNNRQLFIKNSSQVQNYATNAQAPVLRVGAGDTVWVYFTELAFYDNNAQSLSNPFFDLQAGSTAYAVFSNLSNANGTFLFQGVAGSTFIFVYDSTFGFDLPSNPGYGGTFVTIPFSFSKRTYYDDLLVNPQLGASDVQGAIDALKSNPPTTPNTIIWQTHPVQTITGPASQFLPQGSYHRFTSAGNITLTSTPTIQWPGAVVGQTVILHNVGSPGTGHVTLNAGVGTGLSLSNANSRIDEGGTSMLVYNGAGVWTEVTHTQATST